MFSTASLGDGPDLHSESGILARYEVSHSTALRVQYIDLWNLLATIFDLDDPFCLGMMSRYQIGGQFMLYRLFRLPPIVYFILAPLVLALGVFMFVYENGRDAERQAALSHDAPAEIALTAITSDETGNDFNEVVVRAQADVENMIEMVKTKRGSERGRKLFTPLFPADAEDFSGEVLAIMEIDGMVTDQQLDQMYVDDGAVGPILLINGVLEGGHNGDANEALASRVNLASDYRTIKPFINGRQAGLEPKGMGSTMLILGLIIAAILGGFGFFRKRSLDKRREMEEAEYTQA